MEPFRVVITGGPCAGKTEVWRFLGEAFPCGVLVPEAATELILAGMSVDRVGLEAFQRAVYARQLALEGEGREKGLLLFCDRGLLDGLAYLPGLFTSLEVSPQEILGRYAMVLHLEVIRDPRAYRRHVAGNPARRESHTRALSLETAIRKIYGTHPAYTFLPGSLEEKKRAVHELLRESLAAHRPDLAAIPADHA